MIIAVTGASGFIGNALVPLLGSLGHQVRSVVRRVDGRSGVSQFQEDVFAGCDAVIHLAARAHMRPRRDADPGLEAQAFAEANVNTLENAMAAAANWGVRRFVLVSSIGVNGAATHGVPFAEGDVPSPVDMYARSKLSAERVLLTRAAEFEMEGVIVRPTLVYGPSAPGNFGLLLRAVSSGVPLPFRSLRAQRNLMSVWSLAQILERCATVPKAAGRIFLAADADRVDLPTILEALAKGMGQQSRVIRVPVRLLYTLAQVAGQVAALEKLGSELLVDAKPIVDRLGVDTRGLTVEHLVRAGRLHRASFVR